MGFLMQLGLLTQKNLTVIWRSKLWLFGEIALGLLLLPLIIFIVNKPTMEDNPSLAFDPVRITGTYADLSREIKNTASIRTKWCMRTQKMAYYTANNSMAEEVLREVHKRYKEEILLVPFVSIQEMLDVLKEDFNSSQTLCGKYLGGVHFKTISRDPPLLSYKFYFPKRHAQWHLDEFWPPEGPYASPSDLNSIPVEPPYWVTGLLSIQFAIEQTFLQSVNKTTEYEIFLQRMPWPSYHTSSVVAFLKSTPIFWMLLVFTTVLHTAKNVVMEKEIGIKTYMMVMGMKPMVFYASHFLINFAKASIIIVICAGTLSYGLVSISSSMFVVYSLLLSCCAILFALLISTFVRRPSAALTSVSIGWIALFVIDNFVNAPLSEIGVCMLSSLNPLTAFELGIKSASTFESRRIDLGWLNMFEGGASTFTFGHAFFMLIFDSLLIACLVYYLDSVVPTDDSPRKHPLFFLKKLFGKSDKDKSFLIIGNGVSNAERNGVDETDENMEEERGLNRDEADINIYHLSKTWPSTGQRAIDDLSFRAFRGQITVLLGHNGAGKSTTFSVLCGAVSGSSGDVLICGESIVSNMSVCQQKIGYCPQFNPLFPKLTVREHLKLYARLRCAWDSTTNFNGIIDSLINDVKLQSKMNVLADNLSGGMKRKLCVAIALVGDSPVVLLDEPTAGMDPEARRDISDLLDRVKRNRTILLTTHYMDEADLLGDRIGIMVKGRLVCFGSPEFLKNKFGTGYVLSLVVARSRILSASNLRDERVKSLTDDSTNEETGRDQFALQLRSSKLVAFEETMNAVKSIIKKHAPEFRIEKAHEPEFSIIIPVVYKKYFADMFEELEAKMEKLGVDSFGLSFNTLEQVFLKVGEMAGKQNVDESDSGKIMQCAMDLFRPHKKQLFMVELWMRQMYALLLRFYLNFLRNPSRLLFTTAIVLFSLIGLGVVTQHLGSTARMVKDFNLLNMESISVPLQLPLPTHASSSINFPFIIAKIPRAELVSISGASVLQNELVKHVYDSPPMGIGAAVIQNETAFRLEAIFALFSGAVYHSPPLSLLLISNAILGDKPDSIKMGLEIYDLGTDDSSAALLKAGSNLIVGLVVIVAFTLFTSNFVICLVEDRQRKFKHQMLLTKMSPFIYWLTNTIWVAVVYFAFCLLVAAVFFFFKWVHGCMPQVFALWALYFWSCTPLIFCSSFLFDSPERAVNALNIWNMVLSIIILLMVEAVQHSLPTGLSWLINRVTMLMFPSVPLANGMILIAVMCSISSMSGSDGSENEELLNSMTEEGLGSGLNKDLIMCMFISGLFFWMVLFLLESRTVALKWHQFSSLIRENMYKKIRSDDLPEDEDVAHERIAVNNTDDRELALAVRSIYKYYDRLCAVRNLTFGVRETDCFGLLGVNGAGKTTTFDILTGALFPTAGSAVIGGVNVVDAPVIGYCPQFDALPLDLTGREALLLLARLNGFDDAEDRVNKVLWSIHMTEQADKQINCYSGGQKRRVSIGVTLMSHTRLIMLDEPTAGIDPRTRRYIWQLLSAIRQQNVALLLTSHSMDECEALCNRIGFMNRGSLISIGTSQHLKSRYGSSYMLTFTISNPNIATWRFLDTLIVKEFKAEATQDSPTMSTLHWEVPRIVDGEIVSWSQMFRKAQTIAESYTETANLPPGSETPLIKDYTITQNSLEQVFLRLAGISELIDGDVTKKSRLRIQGTGGSHGTPPPSYSRQTAPSGLTTSSYGGGLHNNGVDTNSNSSLIHHSLNGGGGAGTSDTGGASIP